MRDKLIFGISFTLVLSTLMVAASPIYSKSTVQPPARHVTEIVAISACDEDVAYIIVMSDGTTMGKHATSIGTLKREMADVDEVRTPTLDLGCDQITTPYSKL